MAVTRDEAAHALGEISRAQDKVGQLKGYHYGAPYLILWGFIWLIANTVGQFQPDYAGTAWLAGVALGIIASIALGFATKRGGEQNSASETSRIGWRIALTSLVMIAFVVAITLISQPESSREINATISIFFPFVYMAGGIWAGWRLFAIGFVTAAAILIGYYFIGDWFNLWMGAFGGGSLIAGGLWLRSA